MASKKSKPFDAAKYLENDEAIAEYITEALLTYDMEIITHAIGVAAKARGMSQIAQSAGLSRESLYKALSGDGNPQFDTIFRVLTALGLQLRAEPACTSGHRFQAPSGTLIRCDLSCRALPCDGQDQANLVRPYQTSRAAD